MTNCVLSLTNIDLNIFYFQEANLENRLQVLQLKFEEAKRKRLQVEKTTEEERKRAQHKMAALMNHQ